MPFHQTLLQRLAQEFPMRNDLKESGALAAYSLLLKFFKVRIAVRNLDPGDARIGFMLALSWVQGTVLPPKFGRNFAAARKVLRQASESSLEPRDVDTLRAFAGDSLASTSAFLHFLNPGRFAIWNTHIARAAYRYSWRQFNRADCYLGYLDDLRELSLGEQLRQQVRNAIGRSGALRSKEFALSQLGIAESNVGSKAASLDVAAFPFPPERFTLVLGIEDDA